MQPEELTGDELTRVVAVLQVLHLEKLASSTGW